MNLWLLRPIPSAEYPPPPWQPWYDKAFGFVVRAETEQEARELAQAKGGDELREWDDDKSHGYDDHQSVWTNPELASCVPLTDAGEPGIVMRDFAAA